MNTRLVAKPAPRCLGLLTLLALLNRILNGQHGLRVGVLVSDFGAIDIDAELVEGVEENMISPTNATSAARSVTTW